MGAKKTSGHQQKQKSSEHKHRRIWKWLIGIFVGIAVFVLAIFIWFRISAWPGAMIIRWVFENNGRKTTQALQAHDPKSGIAVIGDQQYVPGDKDAVLDVYMPKNAQSSNQRLPVVIWTHGGAWVSGDKTDAAPYYKLLAQAGFTVIAPNYSLAPEKTYPTPLRQLNALYAYIGENAERFQADTSKIILAGDSAGSQLSAQMAALITNPGYANEVGITPTLKPEQLKGVVLNCGIYKMEELARPGGDVAKLLIWGDQEVVWAYSGVRNFSDPIIKQMSPYYHVSERFPATFITGGNDDPLTDVQSKPFADKLESLDVSVTRLFYTSSHKPPLPHEYQFNLDNTDGQKALEQIVTFLHAQTQ